MPPLDTPFFHAAPGAGAGTTPAIARVLISAAHKSSGKTTLTIGLCAALRERGLLIAPFKKGPDYIDPMWLTRACGCPCYNLDPHLMSGNAMKALFGRKARGADLAIVEGNKGLYDGLALDGSNSNAAVATSLDLPVVLVIDARGMTRGVAPLILGYVAFDRNVRIAGVVLNRVDGPRHEAKLRAAIEHYTDVAVLGAVREDDSIAMIERHLGLTPTCEAEHADELVARIGRRVAAEVDLDALLTIARRTPAPLPLEAGEPIGTDAACTVRPTARRRLRIGIAMDRAFGFYYADDLEALRVAGADLVPFDTLKDRQLPQTDALFIGGGFPETCAAELRANASLRTAIRDGIDAGLPVYAECGGLMYLARGLHVDGKRYEMVGAIEAEVHMHRRSVGRGYVELEPTRAAPFATATPGTIIRGHEFHYSSLSGLPPQTRFAYRVLRGHGIDGQHDGIVHRNVLASYSHLRSGAGSDWARRFVHFAGSVAATRARARQTTVIPAPHSMTWSST